MIYQHITELQQDFLRGKFNMPEEITINEITYIGPDHRNVTWKNIVGNQNIALTVYSIKPGELDNNSNLDKSVFERQKIVFGWTYLPNNNVVPLGVMFSSRARVLHSINESTEIGFKENIIIDGFNNNKPVEAKIDTGADMCSMHADNIQIQNEMVLFDCFGARYRMNIAGKQSVRQADSSNSEARPIINLNIRMANQTMSNVEFNLNDRSQMECPILIGKNLLAKHEFIINTLEDPTLTTEDWEMFDTQLAEFKIPNQRPILENEENRTLEAQQIAEVLSNSQCTIHDIIKALEKGVRSKYDFVTY